MTQLNEDKTEQLRQRIYLAVFNDLRTELRDEIDAIQNAKTRRIIQQTVSEYLDNYSMSSELAQSVANNINHRDIAQRVQSGVVQEILQDQRFNTLVTRHLTAATVGLIDETVERVTAIIEDKTTNTGDM